MKLNPYHPMARGLKYAWLLNEGGGNSAYDSVNGVKGTLVNGTAWTPSGVIFDGVDDNINGVIGNVGLVTTIIQGIKSHSLGNSDRGRMVAIPTDGADGYGVILHNDAYNIRAVFADEWPNENISTSNVVITQNKEHNVAVTHDNTAAPKIYVDGSEVSYASQTFYGTLTSSVTSFIIGANNAAGTFAYDGEIRYTYIYDRVLTPAEIVILDRDPYGMFVPDFTPSIVVAAGEAGVANAGALMMAMMI